MANLKRILSKTGWTGRELGILELTNMAVLFKAAQAGEVGTPIVPLEQFRAMLNELTDSKQIQVYNGYISIHQWLALKYNMAYGQAQIAAASIQELISFITTAMTAEDTFTYIEQSPAIMTQKQYDEEKQARLTAICKGHDATGLDLVFYATEYYLNLLHVSPRKANPLKALKKEYVEQVIDNDYICDTWRLYYDSGYYTLPDGRRSDQMDAAEWKKATTPPRKQDMITMREGMVIRARALYEGASREEAEKALEDYNVENGLIVKTEWHAHEKLESPPTKWDVIEEARALYDEDRPAFQRDFSDLIKAMTKDIKKKYGITVESMDDIILTGQQLYDLNFYGAKERFETGLWGQIGDDFKANRRAALNGIAIVTPSALGRHITDKNGYYSERDPHLIIRDSTLTAFYPDNENFAQHTRLVENDLTRFYTSMYFLYGYNTAIDMIAKHFGVPELKTFKTNLSNIESNARDYNKLLVLLYDKISRTDYDDKALKEKKLTVLKDIFGAVDVTCVHPIPEHVAEAKKLLNGFQAFTDENGGQDKFMNLLFMRPTNGGADNG